jgi:hypothetical protein
MHPRRAIVEDLLARLAAGSPPAPVYEQEQTATEAVCFQVALESEDPNYDESTRGKLQRMLVFSVTARGTSPTERDALCEFLETAMLGAPLAESNDTTLTRVELGVPVEGGQRTYPATYTFAAMYFTTR